MLLLVRQGLWEEREGGEGGNLCHRRGFPGIGALIARRMIDRWEAE